MSRKDMPDTSNSPAPISYVDIGAQFAQERDELMPIIEDILKSGMYVGGPWNEKLEAALAKRCGTKHVVTLNSGTDALILALAALGIGHGDEVITPPNSFVASTAVIAHVGATPVFADVLPDQNIDPAEIEKKITPKTKAIMPVHLTGRIADMGPIREIAQRHGLAIIEDAAQSIGSLYDGVPSGALGDVGCFSAHPLKNLNACGDAGFLTTDRDDVAEYARLYRNHGLVDRNTVTRFGSVSRLDAIQAAILHFRLGSMDTVIENRRRNAALYRELLDPKLAFMPPCRDIEFNTFHTFVIQVDGRDALQAHLGEQGIGTAIHYPVPIHLQPAAEYLGHKAGDFPVTERQSQRILTLPVHQNMTEADVRRVADVVNRFLASAV
ncbi:DegT/DnrJ/EryC1/StrS family aminotransferase [Nisaea acidiphila]|uniref:DegT/DnrJ/EryC1/StrS family aminotransferase n=1 Tax=Nisaea acidiphila TaxID=1862145 RepID=A0A9J7AP93_9PROT|nr:DegT/DnrJ/EryC1/StrS family aminotransferase [Nisaea acidiphila]UUX48417.1 DegT/DnrJ/EryC1/StrS family aminotransferase [Nisaea acidiphila]